MPPQTDAPVAAPVDRVEVVERRFSSAVVLAALAAIPATFLTMFEGTPALAGTALHWVSLGVLTAESVVLLVLAGDRIAWLRRHWFPVAVVVATIPAVAFALGPVQILRLVRFVGALRIMRVRRILKAGRILRRRAALPGPLANGVAVGVTLACAVFVALVLADPTSFTRQALEGTWQRLGVISVLAAGALVGVATFVVRRYRTRAVSQPGDAGKASGMIPECSDHSSG